MAPVAGVLGVAFDALGQAEIGDVRLSLGIEQDVARLEVAVQHAALVGVMDGAGNRRQQFSRRPLGGERKRRPEGGR